MKRKTIPKANPGIFDYQNSVESLAQQPSPLDRLLGIVDFERFRPALTARRQAVIKPHPTNQPT